jgi:hypothetical protein
MDPFTLTEKEKMTAVWPDSTPLLVNPELHGGVA